jgi:hypothetical protein
LLKLAQDVLIPGRHPVKGLDERLTSGAAVEAHGLHVAGGHPRIMGPLEGGADGDEKRPS